MSKNILLILLLLVGIGSIHAKRREKRAVVRLETTSGTIRIALLDETPVHRDNFLRLAREGVFDGVLFHRVIRDFMIQGGDTLSRHAQPGRPLGDGDIGYTLPAEIQFPYYYHLRGMVGAAREGDEVNPQWRSSGSQFYIVWGRTWSPKTLREQRDRLAEKGIEMTAEMMNQYEQYGGTPHLDGQYTLFGQVTEGMNVVKEIQGKPTDSNDRPLADIRILRAVVEQESKATGKKGKL